MQENKTMVLEEVKKILQEIIIKDDEFRKVYYAKYSRHRFETPADSVRENLDFKLGELMNQLPNDIKENQEFRFELMQLVAPVAIARGKADVVDIVEYCPAAINADYYDQEILKGHSILEHMLEYDTYNLERVVEEVPEVIKHMPQNTEISKILFRAITTNRELLELDSVKEYISKDPELDEKISEILERENKEKRLEKLMGENNELNGRIEELRGKNPNIKE